MMDLFWNREAMQLLPEHGSSKKENEGLKFKDENEKKVKTGSLTKALLPKRHHITLSVETRTAGNDFVLKLTGETMVHTSANFLKLHNLKT